MTSLLDHIVLAQAQADPSGGFGGLLDGIDADKRFVLLIVAIGCGTGLVLGTFGILSSVITSLHRRRTEMDLKREMIDRGMTADEISKVVEAITPPEDATQRLIASWAKKKTG